MKKGTRNPTAKRPVKMSVSLPKEERDEIVAMADANGRTISGQMMLLVRTSPLWNAKPE